MNKNEDIKQLLSRKHANSSNLVRNPPYFSLSWNIILKIMLEFLTQLVEIVHEMIK